MARSGASKQTLTVEGRQVPVSNLDKVLYPTSGFTKAEVIDYYIRVSPYLLPHLKDRPVTLKRYPTAFAESTSTKKTHLVHAGLGADLRSSAPRRRVKD